MKRIACISFLMILGSPLLGFGQYAKGTDGNLENLSGQYAECAAYYRLVYHAMNSSNEKETANAYHKLEDTATLYSLLLANEGRKRDVGALVGVKSCNHTSTLSGCFNRQLTETACTPKWSAFRLTDTHSLEGRLDRSPTAPIQ